MDCAKPVVDWLWVDIDGDGKGAKLSKLLGLFKLFNNGDWLPDCSDGGGPTGPKGVLFVDWLWYGET